MNCICLYTVQTYHKKMFTVYELYMFIYSPNLSQKMFTVYELYMFIYSPNLSQKNVYCI